jgi:hypothetical protein
MSYGDDDCRLPSRNELAEAHRRRIQELEAALAEARQVIVTACGEKAPYARIALQRIDAALRAGTAALTS